MRPELQYIADTILIESLLKDDFKIALAQDNSVMSTALGGLKSYVGSIFKKDQPISSIMSLFADGLLFSLGGKKLGILYSLAGAFGFDWQGFWHSIGEGISNFVKEILSSGKKADASTTSSKVNDI